MLGSGFWMLGLPLATVLRNATQVEKHAEKRKGLLIVILIVIVMEKDEVNR